MEKIFEDYGIEISEEKGNYYLTYDEGVIVSKDITIETTKEDAIRAQFSSRDAYEVILKYQNRAKKF